MILIFSVFLMFVYSWELALITLASAPLFLLVFWGFNKLNRKYQRKIMESSADLESQLVESLNSAASVYSYSAGTLVSKDDAQFVQEMTKIVDEHMSNSDLTPDTLATLMKF